MEVCPKCGHRLRLSALSVYQRKVLRFMSEGLSNGQIAEARGVTVRTIEHHVQMIFAALQLPPGDTGRRVMATRIYVEEVRGII